MDIDKIPIGVKPTNRMDFEQLLEEKLRISEQLEEEQARMGVGKKSILKKKQDVAPPPPDDEQQQPQSNNSAVKRQPKVFLKKGEGLKKYMPKPKVSKQQQQQEQAKNRLSSGSTTTVTRVTSNGSTTSKSTSTTPTNNKNSTNVDNNLRKITSLTENAIKMATTSSSNLRAPQPTAGVKKASPEPQSTSSLAKTNSLSSVSSSSLCSLSSEHQQQQQKLKKHTESLSSLNDAYKKSGPEKQSEVKRVRVVEPAKTSSNFHYYDDNTNNNNNEEAEHDDDDLREFESMEQYITEHPSINLPHGELVTYIQKHAPQHNDEIAEVEEIDEREYDQRHDDHDEYSIKSQQRHRDIYDQRSHRFQEREDNRMNGVGGGGGDDDEYDEYYRRYRHYEETNGSVEEQVKTYQVSKRKVKRLSDDNDSFDAVSNFTTATTAVQETRKTTANYVLDDDSRWAVDPARQSDIDSDFEGDEFKPSQVSNYLNTLFPSLKVNNKQPPSVQVEKSNLKSQSKSSLHENGTHSSSSSSSAVVASSSSSNSNNSGSASSSSSTVAAGLKEKLHQLEYEIKKFKEENEKVEKLKCKLSEEVKLAEATRKVAFKQREDEIESLKRGLEEETRKLKIERKVFEQYKQSCKENPTRRERDEIESLKKQVQELQNELKSKEARWIANNNRHKERIEALEQENAEQKRALQLIEKQRLEMLVKKTTSPSTTTNTLMTNGFNKPTFTHTNSDFNIYDTGRERIRSPFDEDALSSKLNKDKLLTTTSKQSSSALAVHNHHQHQLHQEPPEYFTSILSKKKLRVVEVKRIKDEVEKVLEDGSVVCLFPNGTIKELDPERKRIFLKFHNGDYKDVDLKSKTDTYFYHETQVVCKTDLDSKNQVITFPNGQIDKIFADGTKEITYPNKVVEYTAQNGDKIVEYPNGQREISTKEYKKREFPDGSWKIVYADGSTEARYPNGRIICKDARRNIISDSKECC